MQRDPLLILDGAHNPDGAQAVVETLAEGFVVTGDLHLVIGVLDGRDPVELLEILDAEDAAEVVCCTPDSPRALPAAALAEHVRALGGRAQVIPDVGLALGAALDRRRTRRRRARHRLAVHGRRRARGVSPPRVWS